MYQLFFYKDKLLVFILLSIKIYAKAQKTNFFFEAKSFIYKRKYFICTKVDILLDYTQKIEIKELDEISNTIKIILVLIYSQIYIKLL